MKPNTWIACGALLAAMSVAAGAFGAHGLTAKLKGNRLISAESTARRLDVFQTAARYHTYHALAIVVVGLIARRSPSPCLTVAGWSFVAGIALFCGSLYLIALGGMRELGRAAPIGGAGFIVGWTCLAIAAWRAES